MDLYMGGGCHTYWGLDGLTGGSENQILKNILNYCCAVQSYLSSKL